MIDETNNLRLPKEIERYIASLEKVYQHQNQGFLQSILVNARIDIEQTSYDRWDGGQYGFTLRLMIPDVIFVNVIETKDAHEKKIKEDINRLISINGEFIESVSLEMALVSDESWREKSGHLLLPRNEVTVSASSRIWGNESKKIKMFLSHKAEYKKQTADLKLLMERFGFTCFVAHEDIQPTKEWQDEIENALFSMDVLVALMTEDFHNSNWTDQEIGVAIGRGVLVIPVKMGKDPYGFIGKYQALNGSWQNITQIARGIFAILVNHSRFREALFKSAIYTLEKAASYDISHFVVKDILPHFGKLNPSQVNEIQEVYKQNDQIYGCYLVGRDLPNILNNLTGKKYKISNRSIVENVPQVSITDEIPF
jgi:hypothetical protein